MDEEENPQEIVLGPIGIKLWQEDEIITGMPLWVPDNKPETIEYCIQLMEQRLACGQW